METTNKLKLVIPMPKAFFPSEEDRLFHWVTNYAQKHGRLPTIGLTQVFFNWPKTSCWRRLRKAKAGLKQHPELAHLAN